MGVWEWQFYLQSSFNDKIRLKSDFRSEYGYYYVE